jgi:hypothetical protein
MHADEGWLERSLDQAHRNIQSRPDHLKPERYRTSGTARSDRKPSKKRSSSRRK